VKLLFAIPHYYDPSPPGREEGRPDDEPRWASRGPDPAPRLAALTACLTALYQLYDRRACVLHHDRREAWQIDCDEPWALDVVICTTRGRHLLDQRPVSPRQPIHQATDADPPFLGFECHAVLRDRLGDYDYYAYLEDDLVLHDPWLFRKLAWFNGHVGDDKLLHPNRYEAAPGYALPKLYVDGDLAPRSTAPFQDTSDSVPLAGEVMGVRVEFHRTLNPHSGCFFLNARQMAHWAAQPYFLDRDVRFMGPLESAATLGILRTFRIYRPAPANADFLEVQHFGRGYLDHIVPAEIPGTD
jgi:hypothetical protein